MTKHGAIQEPFLPTDAEAIQYYKWINDMSSAEFDRLVYCISMNGDLDTETVETGIRHLCTDEHLLNDGRFERFDEDIEIARSIARLIAGNPQPHDMLLIEHEAIEHYYMYHKGYSSSEAHNKSNEQFNYEQALMNDKNNGYDTMKL